MKKKENIKNLIIALIFGVIAFIFLLVVNHKFSQSDTDMLWSVKPIPQGMTLTDSNISEFIESIPTNERVKNNNVVLDKKDLIGLTASRDINSSELIQKDLFVKESDIRAKFTNPVLVSFAATDFSSATNGIIRKGDYINVSKIETKSSYSSSTTTSTDTTVLSSDNLFQDKIVKDAYVVDAFDSSGKLIEPGDTTSIATSFNIYVEQDNESAFYNAVNDKNVAVSKISK